MMAQYAKGTKLFAASRPFLRTSIHLLVMSWASDVVIEGRECHKLAVTKGALETVSVERECGSGGSDSAWRGNGSVRPLYEARRVCNDVRLVEIDGDMVDMLSFEFSTTSSRLQMRNKTRSALEAPYALAPSTENGPISVLKRMGFEVRSVLERFVAFEAEAMYGNLMLSQPSLSDESNVADPA